MKKKKSFLHSSSLIPIFLTLVFMLVAPASVQALTWTYYDQGNQPLVNPTETQIKENAVTRISDTGITQYALEIDHDFSGTWGTGYLENFGNPSPGVGKHWYDAGQRADCWVDGIVVDVYDSRYVAVGYHASGSAHQGKAQALRFDGANDNVSATGINLIDKNFTIEFSARRMEKNRKDYIVSQGTPASEKGFHIGFRADNKFEFGVWGHSAAVSAHAYSDIDWHHWKCTYTVKRYRYRCLVSCRWPSCNCYWQYRYGYGYILEVYRDGVKVATREIRNAYSNHTLRCGFFKQYRVTGVNRNSIVNRSFKGSGTFYMGRGLDGSAFKGEMKDVKVTANNKVLALWNFDDGKPSLTAEDSSGADRTGTLNGFDVDICWVADPTITAYHEFDELRDRQAVPQFNMNDPTRIIYEWDLQYRVVVGTSPLEDPYHHPLIMVPDGGDWQADENAVGTGQYWYNRGSRLKLSAGEFEAGILPEYDLYREGGIVKEEGEGDSYVIDGDDGLTEGLTVTWRYESKIYEETVKIGNAVTFSSVPEDLRNTIKPQAPTQTTIVAHAPQNSTPADMCFWSDFEKRLYPVRPGTILLKWETDTPAVKVLTEVTVEWPETSHYVYIVDTPPVPLDPDPDDGFAFKEMKYTEGDASITANQEFTAGQTGKRSVLLFTRTEPDFSLSFDGVDDMVEVPYSLSLNMSHFTVSFRAKPLTGSYTSRTAVVSSRDGEYGGYAIYAGPDNRWNFLMGDGSAYKVVEGPDIVGNQWVHVAGTYDGHEMRLYVDGKLEGTVQADPSALSPNTVEPLRIGGQTLPLPTPEEDEVEDFFRGNIADARIYNVALTQAQIQSNMHTALLGDERGLAAWFRLDDAGSTTIADSSIHEYTAGTLVNMDPDSSWACEVCTALPGDPVPPATGDLTTENLMVRVVETRPWAENLRTADARIGTEITSDAHGRTVPHNGYVLFWESARYNAEIYDPQAMTGPIIPVNQQHTTVVDDDLVVIWYKLRDNLSWPYQPVTYTCLWPDDRRIVIASRFGSEGKDVDGNDQMFPDVNGDLQNYFDPARYKVLKLYNQPDPTKPGYNPNEEHALVAPSFRHAAAAPRPQAAFALQVDLNKTEQANYTSHPFVLVQYYDEVVKRHGMAAFRVHKTDPSLNYTFQYSMKAGQPVVAPYPLDTVIGAVPPKEIWGENGDGDQMCYWEDHKGQPWAIAGSSYLKSYFYYPLDPSFWCDPGRDGCQGYSAPGDGTGDVGKTIPWLEDPPVGVIYDVTWPDDVPVLKAGETLTFSGGEYRADNPSAPGLPGVLGWAAGQVVYDALNPSMDSTKLKDTYLVRVIPSLIERTVPLPLDKNYPDKLKPASKKVDVFMGRWYFKDLHAGLKRRFFYDPMTEELGFRGFINDKTLGDDGLTASPPSVYVLQPNIMTEREKQVLMNLHGGNQAFQDAVNVLYTLSRDPGDVEKKSGDYYGVGLSPSIGLTGRPWAEELTVSYQLTAESMIKLDEAGAKEYVKFTQEAFDKLKSKYEFLNKEDFDRDWKTHCSCEHWLCKYKEWCLNTHIPTILDSCIDKWFVSEEELKKEIESKLDSVKGKAYPDKFWPLYCEPSYVSYNIDDVYALILPHVERDAYTIINNSMLDKPNETIDEFDTALKTALGKYHDALGHILEDCRVEHDDKFFIGAVEASLKGKPYLTLDDFEHDLYKVIDPVWYAQKAKADAAFNLASPRPTSWYVSKILESVENIDIISEKVLGPGVALVPNGALLDPNDPIFSGFTEGYVTIAENNHPDLGDLPVALHVIKVVKDKYRGAIKTMFSDNVFDEKITLRHTADFGARPGDLKFQWWYREEEGTDQPPPDLLPEKWKVFPDESGNDGLGMSEISLAGAGAVLLVDNLFFCRYRHKDSDADDPSSWSDWAGAANSRPPEPGEDPADTYQAQLAPGWVKRVLDAVNPFEARIRDFYASDSPATYVSMIQQAGPRYEGPVPFNPEKDVIENLGLIELYQTVLDRAMDLSIDLDQPASTSGVTAALLLAATRIGGFYALLGNEAYTDALDPTVGIGSESTEYGSLAPTIFTFMNQVPSLLDEELILLRGRDEEGARPAYNRLLWNFTKGEGEVAYALSYNINDVNQDGFIDEADGRTMYPQGHGDAWGHYLTALKSYYDLLTHPHFNWESRAELFSVEGVVMDVDYLDERKFAEIAASKAKVGAETVNMTYRSKYVEDPDGQWQGYTDTEKDRAWGVSEWGERAFQGALFDWLTANAILPAEDPDPEHDGLKKIDRTTVFDLLEIASQARSIQQQADSANTGLNPLGLATDVVPFDIDPNFLEVGSGIQAIGHFAQIYERTLEAMENAQIIFDHASDLKNRIREVASSEQEFREEVLEQDRDYRNQLIELFGTPYQGTIGPGKPYPAGYQGPDYFYYNYIDVNTVNADTVPEPGAGFKAFFEPMNRAISSPVLEIADPTTDLPTAFAHFFETDLQEGTFTATDYSGVLEVDFPMGAEGYSFQAPASWGLRRSPGEIQQALTELVLADADLQIALADYDGIIQSVQSSIDLLTARSNLYATQGTIQDIKAGTTMGLNAAIVAANTVKLGCDFAVDVLDKGQEISIESLPKVVGLATDVTAPGRATINAVGFAAEIPLKSVALGAEIAATAAEALKDLPELIAEREILKAEYKYDVQQQLKEIEAILREEAAKRLEIFQLREQMRQVSERYRAVLSQGLRLMEERKAFNAKVAAKTQGKRYEDMAFRVSRNDALSKYRSAFDLAARYVYLAAKAYDYETNLADGDPASAKPLLTDIMRQRTLGQASDGGYVVGQGGLGDVLARLWANYRVLEGQMGFNNPQIETGKFSLKKELFRINGDPQSNEAMSTWSRELEKHRVADLWKVPEFRKFCRPFTSEEAGPQPGIVIRFSTTVTFGHNFFGWPLGGGDHAYDPTNFATKVRSVGLWFDGYDESQMSETPRVYLIPAGMDVMLVPDSYELDTREWNVVDQKLPVPLPVGDSDLKNPIWYPGIDSLAGSMVQIRRYSSFRAYPEIDDDPDAGEMTFDCRIVGRSVWNDRWVLIIPGGTFHYDADYGLDTFVDSVTDIKLFFETYAMSGN